MRLFGNIKGGGRVAGVLKLWKPEASINEKSDYRGVGLPVEVAEGFCRAQGRRIPGAGVSISQLWGYRTVLILYCIGSLP
jgi:hypothetical protein